MLTQTKTNLQRSMAGIERLEAQMTFRFSVLSKLLDQQMASIAATHGLTLGAYRALATTQAFGTITAADLTRYTAYDKAAVSRHVAELVDRDLINTRQDPAHGRRKLLTVTKAGAAKLSDIRPQVDARRDALSSVLSADEEHVLMSAIDKLSTHITRPGSAAS